MAVERLLPSDANVSERRADSRFGVLVPELPGGRRRILIGCI